MIGHLIPAEDEYWECFLKLLQILRMPSHFEALANTTDAQSLQKTRLSSWKFSLRSITMSSLSSTKMHYMVHMPRLIRQ